MTSITLKKISEVLGLSISTISRALKDHPDISAITKRKVQELAAALEYEPNISAINLRSRHSMLLGLIIPSISRYFYDSFIYALEEETRKQGYSLLILQTGENAETEHNNIRICRQNRVSGVFASLADGTTNVDDYLRLKEIDIPVIFFDKVPDRESVYKVTLADAEAASLAAQALLKKGKRNILAIFGNPNYSITRRRLEAFTTIVENAGIDIVVDYAYNPLEAQQATERHFKQEQKPDSVFCMSDEILTGVMKCLQELKISIPGETGVIAISNGFFPRLYYPEITYVETSGYKLGKLAFITMLQLLKGEAAEYETYTKAYLVEGSSL